MKVFKSFKNKRVHITGTIGKESVRFISHILYEIISSKRPEERFILSFEDAKFKREIDLKAWFELWEPLRMIREASEESAAKIDFEGWGIVPVFRNATFRGKVNFSGSRFPAYTDFSGAKFYNETTFNSSYFGELTTFVGAEFRGKTCFDWAHFGFNTNFQKIKIYDKISFIRASFEDKTSFFMSRIYPRFYIHLYDKYLLTDKTQEYKYLQDRYKNRFEPYSVFLLHKYILRNPIIIEEKLKGKPFYYIPKHRFISDLKSITIDFKYTKFGNEVDFNNIKIEIPNSNILLFVGIKDNQGDITDIIHRSKNQGNILDIYEIAFILDNIKSQFKGEFIIITGWSDIFFSLGNSYFGEDFDIDIYLRQGTQGYKCYNYAINGFKKRYYKIFKKVGTYVQKPSFYLDFKNSILNKGRISLDKDPDSIYRTELSILKSSIVGNITVSGTIDVMNFSKNNINALVHFEPYLGNIERREENG